MPHAMMTSDDFAFRLEDGIGHLELNRPPVNALGRRLIAGMHAAALRINEMIQSRQEDLRVVVLSAAGKHFCAGADLKERRVMPETEVAEAVDATRDMVSAIAAIRVPVIAAVQGSALGGGMELALAADIRLLAASAKMGLRETALAIIPGAGGTQRLPRLIGAAHALYWIATGRVFPAADCLRFGVATAVVPDAELRPATLTLAREIAANGPLAVQAAKEAVHRGMSVPLEDGLEIERQCYAKIIPTRDRIEALEAFQEKRRPVFTGE